MNVGKFGGGVSTFCLLVMVAIHVIRGGGKDGQWTDEDPGEILDYVITAITILVKRHLSLYPLKVIFKFKKIIIFFL